MRSINRIFELLTELRDETEQHATNLQDKFDSRSEKWQEGEEGEQMQVRIEDLTDLQEQIELAADAAGAIINS